MNRHFWRYGSLLLAGALSLAAAWGQGPEGRQGPRQPVPAMPATEALDVILGRPGPNSVSLSILCYGAAMPLKIRYGLAGAAEGAGPSFTCTQGQPREVKLEGLRADSAYRYEIHQGQDGKLLRQGAFHTQRPAGRPFVFTLTADSHLDNNTDPALYQRTLANALADKPDFHLDLGDTFMVDKHESRDDALRQYQAQRAYFGTIGASLPLFLVLGNHDGEERRLRREGPASLAAWSNAQRKRYFPNPQPDGFYSGNAQTEGDGGLLQDYYGFVWGDALFLVLNPYWHGSTRRGEEPWELTLGEAQYQWLKRTLESSKTRYKFVFVHQLVGGFGRQGRGGVEALEFGEWGGRNSDGSEGFKARRPGWEMPIHALLVRHGVSAVFHGHDHLYAQQKRDGIVYQEVPQPGHPGEGVPRFAAEYGYREGTILGGAGHLRISLGREEASVEFVRASLVAPRNAQVAHRYSISARP